MTILIKGVQILSGGQRLTEKSDIFISGDKISAIGNFPAKIADRVIEGHGCYVSPGFIDINTDSDHYLSIFSNPAQEDFIRQGVTTIIGGQCGSSLAPLLYGRLDSIQKWTDITKYNVSWHELEELLSLIEKHPLGINFGTLIGHATIRRDIIGEEIRDLTKNELRVFEHVLKTALGQGGFGLSTGLGYVHSSLTPQEEIESLTRLVRSVGGVYTSHLRESEELVKSVSEVIDLVKSVGVKTVISHFVPIEGQEGSYRESLKKLSELSSEHPLYFDLSPFSLQILPLYSFLPTWAKNGGLEIMQKNIHDEWLQKKIQKEIESVDPEKIIISRAETNDVLVGRSLKDCMEMYDLKTPEEALLKIMRSTELRASVFYQHINTEVIMEALAHSRCLIASNAASLSKTAEVILKPERARRTFPKFLALVEEKKIMSIEKAIERITKIPAQLFNIQKRGEVKEGFFADLTGFQNGEILFTVVNGHLAFEKQTFPGGYHGKILRHGLN